MTDSRQSVSPAGDIPPLLRDGDPRLTLAAAWLRRARERLANVSVAPTGAGVSREQLVQAIYDAAAQPPEPPDPLRAAFAHWCLRQDPALSEADTDYAYHYALVDLQQQLEDGDDSPQAQSERRKMARAELCRHLGHQPPPIAPPAAAALQPAPALSEEAKSAAHQAVRAAIAGNHASPPAGARRPMAPAPLPRTAAQRRLAKLRTDRDTAQSQLQSQRDRRALRTEQKGPQ